MKKRKVILINFLLLLFSQMHLNDAFAQSYTLSVCSGSSFSFQKPGASSNVNYTWTTSQIVPAGAILNATSQSVEQSNITQILTNATNAPATIVYLVSATDASNFTLIVTVNPLPVLTNIQNNNSVCSGSLFSFSPSSNYPGATSYVWNRAPDAQNNNASSAGANNINEILINNSLNPIQVKYVYTLTAKGCIDTIPMTVTINPLPTLDSVLSGSTLTTCSGNIFNFTPTSKFNNVSYTWLRAADSSINNFTSGSGTGIINEALTNSSLLQVMANYVITLSYIPANSTLTCTNQATIRVIVNPILNLGNQTVSASCSGTEFMVSPSVTPSNTMYTWTDSVITGNVSGASSVSVPQFFVGQKIINNGNDTATIQYIVTPTTNGCLGSNFLVTVNVIPNNNGIVLTSSLNPPAICSGTTFNYFPTSDTTGTFAWKRFGIAGISNLTATGTNNPQEILYNTTFLPVTATYAFTSSNTFGCSNTQVVTVIVNPATALSSPLNPTSICSNTIFSYIPTSSTAGTSFSWARPSVPGINNPPSGGINNPNEILVNNTNQPITVYYNYNLSTANGCVNNQTVTVQVLPTPVITSLLNPPAVCSGSIFTYNIQSNVAGTVFNWTRPSVAPISNGQSSGISNISETLVNTTTSAVNVTYNYTLIANGCFNYQNITVQVNPTPTITNQSVSICSGNSFLVNPVNVPQGTQFTWTTPLNNPAPALTGDSSQILPQNNISQAINNLTINPGLATYTVTPFTSLCTGSTFNIIVTVNPVPALTDTIFSPICSGTSFNFAATSGVPANTTYTWSNPLQIPINSINGGSAQPVSQPSVSQTLFSNLIVTDTAVFQITPSSNGCSGTNFKLTIPLKPAPALANLVDTICNGSGFFQTPLNAPLGTTYTWADPVSYPYGSVIGGQAQSTGVTGISQILSNTTNLLAQEVYTINPLFNTCQGSSFTLTLVVVPPLPEFQNENLQICSGNPFNATPVSAPPGITYAWDAPTSMFGTIKGQTAATVPQNSIQQNLFSNSSFVDTITYTIFPNYLLCKGTPFSIKVTLIPSPNAFISGKQVICQYPFDSLSINFTGKAPWSFMYTDTSGNHKVSGITTPTYNWITSTYSNTNFLNFSVYNVQDFNCLNIADTFSFVQKVNPLPTGNSIIFIDSANACQNSTDTLLINNFTANPLTYQWTLNGTPLNGAIYNTLYTQSKGLYNVILTNQYGCTDTATAPIAINFYNILKLGDLKFSYDSYCINTPINFTNLSNISNRGTIQWLWDLGDSTTSTAFNTTATYYQSGSRHIKLSAIQISCKLNSVSLDTTISIEFPAPNMLLPSVSAYIGESTQLQARNFPGYQYLWQPTWGIDNPKSQTVNFNFTTTQQYLIIMTAPSGCITTDTLLVRAFDDNLIDILVPKAFTPNGDGINDILYPYLSGIKEFHYFKVFNRFGNLVFSTENPNYGWNGTINGTLQTMGVYIWAAEGIDYKGNLVQRKGQTLLMR